MTEHSIPPCEEEARPAQRKTRYFRSWRGLALATIATTGIWALEAALLLGALKAPARVMLGIGLLSFGCTVGLAVLWRLRCRSSEP